MVVVRRSVPCSRDFAFVLFGKVQGWSAQATRVLAQSTNKLNIAILGSARALLGLGSVLPHQDIIAQTLCRCAQIFVDPWCEDWNHTTSFEAAKKKHVKTTVCCFQPGRGVVSSSHTFVPSQLIARKQERRQLLTSTMYIPKLCRYMGEVLTASLCKSQQVEI